MRRFVLCLVAVSVFSIPVLAGDIDGGGKTPPPPPPPASTLETSPDTPALTEILLFVLNMGI